MKYRAEIDGLRALAVISVILYHAGFKLFGGGYVGVDVFFVISGYLITTIILDELSRGQFSLINFYERRARRILPALFIMVFVCLPFAWFWLLPDAMKKFSESLVAVSAFASNILFWRRVDYFDSATELKPLIHTWSLAVEEQYYLLFPIFLMLAWKLGKRWMIGLLLFMFLISLAGAQWLSTTNPTFNFFMLPTRGWELLMGGFIAFYYARNGVKNCSHTIQQLGSFIGFLLISYSIFAFNDQTPFPGVYALAPTLGTTLIIIFTTPKTFVGKFIGSKLCVAIGLVSYSAYLWHQPMFAFTREGSIEEPSMVLMGLLVFFSFAIGYLSWRYIERPFRDKERFSRGKIFIYSVLCTAVFMGIGFLGIKSNGFEKYWLNTQPSSNVKAYQLISDATKKSAIYSANNRLDNEDCIFNAENLNEQVSNRLQNCYLKYGSGIAVLGDSHATNLFDSLVYGNNARLEFIVGITKNGCNFPIKNTGCQYDEFLNFAEGNKKIFSTIVYEQSASMMLKPDVIPILQDSRNDISKDNIEFPINKFMDYQVLNGVVNYLERLNKSAVVIWFGPRTELPISPKTIIKLGCNYPFTVGKNQQLIYSKLDMELVNLTKNISNVKYLSQMNLYKFNFPEDFINCNETYWIDGNHFSESGEKYFSSRFDFVRFIIENGKIRSKAN